MQEKRGDSIMRRAHPHFGRRFPGLYFEQSRGERGTSIRSLATNGGF